MKETYLCSLIIFGANFGHSFSGGIASGVVLALLTVIVGYVTRIKLARSIKRVLEHVEKTEAEIIK